MTTNTVNLAGYINFPKTAKTTSGKTHFTGSLSVYRTKKDNKAVYDYIRIEAYESVAEALATISEKEEVFVTGALRHVKWTDPRSNATKYMDFVLVNHVYKEVGTYRPQESTPYYPDDSEEVDEYDLLPF